MRLPLPRRLQRYVESMSFPRLFMTTFGLFLLTLVIPDPLPFVDEILLALLSLMVGSVRRQKRVDQSEPDSLENTK